MSRKISEGLNIGYKCFVFEILLTAKFECFMSIKNRHWNANNTAFTRTFVSDLNPEFRVETITEGKITKRPAYVNDFGVKII